MKRTTAWILFYGASAAAVLGCVLFKTWSPIWKREAELAEYSAVMAKAMDGVKQQRIEYAKQEIDFARKMLELTPYGRPDHKACRLRLAFAKLALDELIEMNGAGTEEKRTAILQKYQILRERAEQELRVSYP